MSCFVFAQSTQRTQLLFQLLKIIYFHKKGVVSNEAFIEDIFSVTMKLLQSSLQRKLKISSYQSFSAKAPFGLLCPRTPSSFSLHARPHSAGPSHLSLPGLHSLLTFYVHVFSLHRTIDYSQTHLYLVAPNLTWLGMGCLFHCGIQALRRVTE